MARLQRRATASSRSPGGDDRRPELLVVELRVVVEHGLKLAEVAETVRSRVQYELERMVGLPIASLEVHIEGVRAH